MLRVFPAVFYIFFALSLTLNGHPALAQQNSSLLIGPPENINPNPHGVAAHSGKIRTSLITSRAENIEIPLPNGETIRATLVNFERRRPGNFTWRGMTDPISGVIDVTMTLEKGQVVGTIDINSGSFRIESLRGPDQKYSIEMLDPLYPFEDAASDVVPIVLAQPQALAPTAAGDLASDEIHVMTLYTQDAETGAGGTVQIEAAIQAAIDESNTAFINSNMDARFVLVHAQKIVYTETGDGELDLPWLRTDSGVAILRDLYGADLVGMITETGACGLGYLPGSIAGAPNYAHQVTRRGCLTNKTFTHEHGHNMGMAHNPENASVSGIFTYSHGHWVDGQYRTIMSYSNPCTSGCSRVTQFSDPGIDYLGVATGVVAERDNASTGRQSASVIAAYRNAVTDSDSIEVRVRSTNDDAEENVSNGVMYLNSTDLELVEDGATQQLVGIRFQNLTIPQGARINEAYLTFYVDETSSEATSLSIRAHDTNNAAAFSSSDDDISSRTLTTAVTDWDDLPTWGTTHLPHDSPDLSAVVEEVVDRGGWSMGNAMAFVISGSGRRVAESYDGTSNEAPSLYVDYDMGPFSGSAPVAGFTQDCPDLSCSFTDTSTDADGTIVSWSWSFGDGSDSTSQHPVHVYSTAGDYTISLIVTDDDGDQDISIQSVTVGPPLVTRGPYLQTLTDDSVIVRWRTNRATDSVVRFGTSSGSLTSSASVTGARTEHTVTLNGLNDYTQYFYSIGDSAGTIAGGTSYHFRTAPVPGTSVSTRFWVIGDSGTANSNARNVRDAYKAYAAASFPSDFLLMLGDNAYNSGTDDEYQAAVFDTYPELLRSLPVWPTLGNHDGYSANSSTQSGPYYDIFNLPTAGEAGGLSSGTEAYYAFEYGNIHFIVLDSYETDRSVAGAMLTWLESDLAMNDKPWVIAFWHHPPYTKGSHDSDSETELIEMRQNALPILEAWGVDLVLSGHSHSYERSKLLDGHYGVSSTLDAPTMVLDGGDGSDATGGDGAYEKPGVIAAENEGAVYAVAGSSGKLSPVDPGWPHPVMITYLEDFGSMVIDVNGNTLDAVFIDDTGAVQDDFSIHKPADTTPPQLTGAQAEDITHVLVDFDERVDSATAGNAGNYSIAGLSVSSASLLAGARTVRLTVRAMIEGSTYTLTVNNVQDEQGNPIAASSQASYTFNNTPVTVNLQSGIRDTYIESGSSTIYGAAEQILVDGLSTNGTAKHTLITWDLSNLPANATIQSAKIHLQAFDPSTGTFNCKAMLKDWVEMEANWDNASSGDPWQTPGGTGATDRDSVALCSFGPVVDGALEIDLNADGVEQLQRWVDGIDPNYGMMLGDPSSSDGADFRSSEYATASQRPRLEISYLQGPPCSARQAMVADKWVFFSLPCLPPDASVGKTFTTGPVEADYNVRWLFFSYDSVAGSWVHHGPTDTMEEGRGYLYYSLDAYDEVEVSGDFNSGNPYPLVTDPDPDAGVWNLVGNPHNSTTAVDWTYIEVIDNSTTYGFSEMDPQTGSYECEETPSVGPDCLMWHVMTKVVSGAYVPFDGQAPDPGSLGKFEAMWVRSHRADFISFPDPQAAMAMQAAPADMPSRSASLQDASSLASDTKGSRTQRKSKNIKSKSPDTFIRLVAASGDYSDTGNWLGWARDAEDGLDSRDLEEWTPHAGNPYISILFTNPAFDEVDWGYTRDIRKLTDKPKDKWSFVVRASDELNEVTLNWEGDDPLFKKVELIDEVSGEKIRLRKGDHYTFEMAGGEHPFTIVFK